MILASSSPLSENPLSPICPLSVLLSLSFLASKIQFLHEHTLHVDKEIFLELSYRDQQIWNQSKHLSQNNQKIINDSFSPYISFLYLHFACLIYSLEIEKPFIELKGMVSEESSPGDVWGETGKTFCVCASMCMCIHRTSTSMGLYVYWWEWI